MVARVIGAAIGSISGLMLTRALGPEGRGVWATVLSCHNLIVQTFHLGLPTAHTYLAGRNRRLVPRLLSNLKYWHALSFSCVAVCWLAITWAHGVTPESILLGSVCAFFSATTISQFCLDSLRVGMGDAAFVYWSDCASRLLTALCYLGLMATANVRPVYCILIVAVFGALRAVSLYLSLPSEARPRVSRPSRPLAAYTWSYSSKYMGISLLVVSVFNLDMIATDWSLGHAAAGQYSVAAALVALAAVPFEVFLPMEFAKLSAIRKHSERWSVFKKDSVGFLLGLAFGCVMLLIASQTLVFVFGEKFSPAGHLVSTMLVGYVCYMLHSYLAVLVMAASPSWVMLLPSGVAAASTVPLTLTLEKRYGLMGAAYSHGAIRLLWLFCSVLYAVYFTKVIIPARENREASAAA